MVERKDLIKPLEDNMLIDIQISYDDLLMLVDFLKNASNVYLKLSEQFISLNDIKNSEIFKSQAKVSLRLSETLSMIGNIQAAKNSSLH